MPQHNAGPVSGLGRAKAAALSPDFMLGNTADGCWVVQSVDGLVAGLFLGRADALRFLNHDLRGPRRYVEVATPLTFDFAASSQST